MFESVSAFEMKADKLIRDYTAFAEEGGLLDQFTNINNGPAQMIRLHNLRDHAVSYRDRAGEVIADPSFGKLDAKAQRDIGHIAEQSAAALPEIDDASHPDSIWNDLTHDQKREVIQRLPANEQHTARVRARMKHELKGVDAAPLR